MAKLIPTPITSLYDGTAVEAINENYEQIEAAVENTLSRDGTAPNQMGADFDMNGHDILNIDAINANSLYLDGSPVVPAELVTGSFATAAQGAKADTALQPASIGVTVQGWADRIDKINALVIPSSSYLYKSSAAEVWSSATITTFGRGFLTNTNDANARADLGILSAALEDVGTSGNVVPFLDGVNTWSGIQTIAVSNAVPLEISRTGSASNASISYTTTADTVYAGTSDGLDFAISSSNNLTTASAFGRFSSTGLLLGINGAVSFAGTGAATTRDNLLLTTGTYTPTLTNTTNVAASTPQVTQWMRINNMVHVFGRVDIDVTGAGSAVLNMSLPIASAMTSVIQLAGTACSNATSTPEACSVFGNSTSDTAEFKYVAVNTGNNAFYFTFAYQVL